MDNNNYDYSNDNKIDDNLSLEWIELKESMDALKHKNEEEIGVRMLRKIKENPFVPIGVCATTFCLTYGLVAMKRGDSRKQQLMMRGRVMAQGFTVMAIVSGIMYSLASKAKQKQKH